MQGRPYLRYTQIREKREARPGLAGTRYQPGEFQWASNGDQSARLGASRPHNPSIFFGKRDRAVTTSVYLLRGSGETTGKPLQRGTLAGLADRGGASCSNQSLFNSIGIGARGDICPRRC